MYTNTLHKLGIRLFSKFQKKSEINVYCPKKWGHLCTAQGRNLAQG